MKPTRTEKTKWGNVTRHPRTGELGARLTFHVEHRGWTATYSIDTHGKGSTAVAGELDIAQGHHKRWVARLEECAAAHGQELAIGDALYRVIDLTIPVCQPGERPRVLVGVARIDGSKLRGVPGFPMTLRFDSITAIPANAAIIAEVRAQLETREAAAQAHRTFTAKVGKLLDAKERGGSGGG